MNLSSSISYGTGGVVNGSIPNDTGGVVNGSSSISDSTGGVVNGSKSNDTGGVVNGSKSNDTGGVVNGSKSNDTGGVVNGSISNGTGAVVNGSKSNDTGGVVNGSISNDTGGVVNGSSSVQNIENDGKYRILQLRDNPYTKLKKQNSQHLLVQELKSQQKSLDRLKTVYATMIQEFRTFVSLLFGYKIEMQIDCKSCKLIMNCINQNELSFLVESLSNNEKQVQIVGNNLDLTSKLQEMMVYYIERQSSYPLFFANAAIFCLNYK
jgi:hypothetical protein